LPVCRRWHIGYTALVRLRGTPIAPDVIQRLWCGTGTQQDAVTAGAYLRRQTDPRQQMLFGSESDRVTVLVNGAHVGMIDLELDASP